MKLTMNGLEEIEKVTARNKYQTWYSAIVMRALARETKGITTEAHHILPRSFGGTDSKNNLVNLTLREHFICHLLLTKCSTGNLYYKAVHAYCYMSNTKKYTQKVKTSRMYERLRVEQRKIVSERNKELWSDPAERNKRIETFRQSWKTHPNRLEQKKQLKENSPLKNPEVHKKTIETRTQRGTNVFETNNPMKKDEFIQKKIDAMPDRKGTKHWVNVNTGERRMSFSCPGKDWENKGNPNAGSKKGVKKKKIQCPHCDKQCAPHTLNRHIKARHENKEY